MFENNGDSAIFPVMLCSLEISFLWFADYSFSCGHKKSLKDFTLSAVHNPKYLVKIDRIKAAIWLHVCAELFASSGPKTF